MVACNVCCCWVTRYRYKQIYQESIPCEQLVMQLCDVKQQYTQFGGESTQDDGGLRVVTALRSHLELDVQCTSLCGM